MTIDLQTVFAGITLFGTIAWIYISLDRRISKAETKIQGLEKSEERIDSKFEQIMEKIELMNQKFNELILEFTKIKK